MWHGVHALWAHLFRLFRGQEETLSYMPKPSPVQSDPPITILSLLADQQDRAVMADLARQNHWDVIATESLENARGICERVEPQIVLLDRDLAGEDWRKKMAGLAPASSGACVVLVSKVIDDYLWNEVVLNGGYEILPKPLLEEEVSRTVRLARSYWASANKWASGSSKLSR